MRQFRRLNVNEWARRKGNSSLSQKYEELKQQQVILTQCNEKLEAENKNLEKENVILQDELDSANNVIAQKNTSIRNESGKRSITTAIKQQQDEYKRALVDKEVEEDYERDINELLQSNQK